MAIVRRSPRVLGRTIVSLLLFSLFAVASVATAAAEHATHRLRFEQDDLRQESGRDGVRYVLEGASELNETGAPKLPVANRNYVIPQGMRLSATELEDERWVVVGDARGLALATPLVSDEETTVTHRRAGDVLRYEPGVAYPPQTVLPGGTIHLHGYTLAAVEIFPVRINDRGQVEQLLEATVHLTLKADPSRDLAVRREVDFAGLATRDAREVRRIASNPDDVAAYAPPRGLPARDQAVGKTPILPEGEVDFVIVTVPSLVTEFQRLADHKFQRGITTAVVTVDWILANYGPSADAPETIRLFLQAAYANWGLKYVLLGGDSEVIVPRYARSKFYPGGGVTTDVPADLYFACLDGTWNADGDGIYGEAYNGFLDQGDDADLAAELSVGRAPVKDLASAAVFVDKVIEFEDPSQLGYQGRALFLSEVLFPANWNGVDPIVLDGATFSESIIFDRIIAGGNLMQSWRSYENFPAYFGAEDLFKSAVVDSMNTGRYGLVNHIGHGFYYNMSVGDANLFVQDAEGLTNAPNYFVLYAVNCSSAAFDFNCLLESFVRNPNGGSVASLGACRAAFASTADDYQQGFYDEIFVQTNMRLGDAVRESRVALVGSTFAETPDRWTHFVYTLLGDPTLHMWREDPLPVTLTGPSSAELSDESVTYRVESGAFPILHADVALTRADMPGVMVTAEADLAGNVTLPLSTVGITPGTLDVVVSGQNALTYRTTLEIVTGTGPHVVASLNALTDDGSGGSAGDGDGVADSGETLRLRFDFLNNGDGSSATGVTATLLAVDATGASITDDSIAVGTLAGGANAVPADVFVVGLSPTIGDGVELDFQIELSDGNETWLQDFSLTVLAPELRVVRLTWDDTAGGDGDGIVENGETIDLSFEVRNVGAGDALGLAGNLSTSSGNVSIVDGAAAWADLALRDSGWSLDALQVVEADTSVENLVTLALQDAWGHAWTHEFELRPPDPPSSVATNSLLGPNSIGVELNHEFQFHFAGYRVYRALDQVGPFEEVTLDALNTTGFLRDDDLESLTRYYYYATVTDSSAIESDPSGVVSANTAPPELAEFPLPINRELAGATAVGDIRGDGTQVAAFGADYIYAIDAAGTELADGDLDSQTLGPLGGPGPPNDRFSPSGVALGNLDGDPADEVVGVNWDAKELWALNADGSNVPGFPVSIVNKAWSHPVIGDLDNNGDMEIVIRSIEGNTWVFNHDGSDFFDGDNNPGTIGLFHVSSGENFTRGTATLVDLDGDDTLEIVFPTHIRNGSDNFVYGVRSDGTDAPGWPKNLGPNGFGVTGIVAADLDRNGSLELIYPCDDDQLYVWETDGSDFGVFPQPLQNQGANLDSVTPGAATADLDKDGDLELVLVSVTGNGACFVYIKDHDFTTWPGWPRQLPGRSETSPIIGDVNGDHSPDILVGIGGGSDTLPNQLYAFNVDGSDVQGFPITLNGSVKSTSVICDFDQDGDVDIVYAGYDRLLHVWDMPFPYHPWATPWPTFHANARRTGVYQEDIITAVDDGIVSVLVEDIRLRPNVPNPFNPSTMFRFDVPGVSGDRVPAELAVYDLAGRRVRTLVSGPVEPGSHQVLWNGQDDSGRPVSSGVYFARLWAAGQQQSRKITLLK